MSFLILQRLKEITHSQQQQDYIHRDNLPVKYYLAVCWTCCHHFAVWCIFLTRQHLEITMFQLVNLIGKQSGLLTKAVMPRAIPRICVKVNSFLLPGKITFEMNKLMFNTKSTSSLLKVLKILEIITWGTLSLEGSTDKLCPMDSTTDIWSG